MNWHRLFRIRLIVAIQAFTTLIILGFGYLIVELVRQDLSRLRMPAPDQVEAIVQQLRLEVLIAAVIASLCGMGLAFAILRPLKSLESGAARVAGGDLTSRFKIDAEVEVGRLGDAFNRMVTSLNRYLVEAMSGGSFIINLDGRILTASSGASVILGCQPRELEYRPLTEVFPDRGGNADLHEMFRLTVRRAGSVAPRVMDLQTFRGLRLQVRVSTILLRDKERNLIGMSLTPEDQSQTSHLQEEIYRADRLAALGAMSAGLAHEIRNPLGSVRGMTQLLNEHLPDDHPQRRYTRLIIKEVDRIDSLVNDLLEFAQPARGRPAEHEPYDVNRLIAEALEAVAPDRSRRRIELNLASDVPPVAMDKDQMQRAVMNLITNAIEAQEDDDSRGVVRIESRAVPDRDGTSRGVVVISVFNSDSYVSPEDKQQIFNPFFTTKDKGSGLGLAITHEIVRLHGGRIDLKSEPDGGTEFIVQLPAGV